MILKINRTKRITPTTNSIKIHFDNTFFIPQYTIFLTTSFGQLFPTGFFHLEIRKTGFDHIGTKAQRYRVGITFLTYSFVVYDSCI
jgi:hypothetical protein